MLHARYSSVCLRLIRHGRRYSRSRASTVEETEEETDERGMKSSHCYNPLLQRLLRAWTHRDAHSSPASFREGSRDQPASAPQRPRPCGGERPSFPEENETPNLHRSEAAFSLANAEPSSAPFTFSLSVFSSPRGHPTHEAEVQVSIGVQF